MVTAFVLSGGGSLGAVQVGMLQTLAEQGVHPDLLVGTSVGALNALWVADHGMSTESLAGLAGIWQGLRRRDVFAIRPAQVRRALLGRSPSVCGSEPLGELVRRHCSISDLSDATIPVHMAATDLLTGKAVLISRGAPAKPSEPAQPSRASSRPSALATTGSSTAPLAPHLGSPTPSTSAPRRSTSCPRECRAHSPGRLLQRWAWPCTPSPS